MLAQELDTKYFVSIVKLVAAGKATTMRPTVDKFALKLLFRDHVNF